MVQGQIGVYDSSFPIIAWWWPATDHTWVRRAFHHNSASTMFATDLVSDEIFYSPTQISILPFHCYTQQSTMEGEEDIFSMLDGIDHATRNYDDTYGDQARVRADHVTMHSSQSLTAPMKRSRDLEQEQVTRRSVPARCQLRHIDAIATSTKQLDGEPAYSVVTAD